MMRAAFPAVPPAPPHAGRRAHPASACSAQRGTALVVALLMMLLVALLGVSMMRSTGMESRMVGNVGEKQHAFQAAQTALQYGEWWLAQIDNASTGVTCNNTTPSPTPVVCNNAMTQTQLTTLPWSGFGAYYSAPTINGASPLSSANINTSGGAGNYYAQPQVYIYYLGQLAGSQAKLYQVTSAAYGGNANSVAVVQSTFEVSSAVKDLGAQ